MLGGGRRKSSANVYQVSQPYLPQAIAAQHQQYQQQAAQLPPFHPLARPLDERTPGSPSALTFTTAANNTIIGGGVISGAAGPNATGASTTSRLQAARESVAVLAEMLSMLDNASAGTGPGKQHGMAVDSYYMGLFDFALKVACVLSMLSVCLHTPQTIVLLPFLAHALLIIDVLVTAFFTLEALLRMNASAWQDRWFQFDLALLAFHYLSIALHSYELLVVTFPGWGLNYYAWYGVVRSPRPFIMVRLIRAVLRFKLPRQRIQQIIKRSSQQIRNATLFFLFFLFLYAIMGVQLFGRMEFHCVMPGTDPRNVTINDLAIPDTLCNANAGSGGYECPPAMECRRIYLTAHQSGFYGMFNDFASSLFTVYLAASQEGWVYVLYDCLDSFPSYVAFAYFITLIFFLAWLVKNVFIAVITETFAEIRVQFSEMWQAREPASPAESEQKTRLQRDEKGEWRLVDVDEGATQREKSNTPIFIQRGVKTTAFRTGMMALVLLNALINASFVAHHDKSDEERKRIYYFIELAFTLLFNLECVVKMVGLGWTGYIRRGQHKFELVLCVGSSLNVVPSLYGTHVFTYFQVLRILRLIKASPMLEDFVYKIFGPGKKLGGLVVFTMILLVTTSAVSLQLFCYVERLDKFRTFPQALSSMFQIITQEGWTEVVVEILRSTNESFVPLVAAYFVGYHLFVTLIVLSLFVAVILDNLEMDEELKKVKQLRAREETTCMRTTLPWRLRVFQHFPTRPQMLELKRVGSDFPLPKVRDSFTRHFFATEMDDWPNGVNVAWPDYKAGSANRNYYHSPSRKQWHEPQQQPQQETPGTTKLLRLHPHLRCGLSGVRLRQSGELSSKNSVSCLIEESNKCRVLLSDSTQHLISSTSGTRKGSSGGGGFRVGGGGTSYVERRQRGQRGFMGASLKAFKAPTTFFTTTAEGMGNGDIGVSDAAARANVGSDGGNSKQQQQQSSEIDLKALQQRRAHAEFTRQRIEEEMRENHPLFDRPLFAVGRDSRLRRLCQTIVEARYSPYDSRLDSLGGWHQQQRYGGSCKQLRLLLSLLTYLDWTMVLVTAASCCSMLAETPWPPAIGGNMVYNNGYLRITEYLFVVSMTFELLVKIIADGLFFTPNAVVKDWGGVMTVFIYITSFCYLVWMPSHVEINSMAQLLMIFRAMRPLRIYTLVPHIRRVVVELCKGFKEILLVTILLVLLMFVFASLGVQSIGGKLAACNDPTINSRENCTGIFEQKLFVTRMEVYGKNDDILHPKIFVPRVWTNPRNFNFDHIGNAMLALYETLSYKEWNVMRDILWARQGPWAVLFIHIYVFIGCMIGLTLFVGVVIANYMENRGTALLTVDQRRWHDLKARLRMAQPLHVPPKPAESDSLRNYFYELTMGKGFKQFYAFLVVANSALLVVPWNVDEESEREQFLYLSTAFSALCTVLFSFEIILKMVAYTVFGFWQSRRNRIDLLITLLGLTWSLLHFGVALPASLAEKPSLSASSTALPATSTTASSAAATKSEMKRFTYTFGYIVVIMRFFTITGRKSTLKMLFPMIMTRWKVFFYLFSMLTVFMSMIRSLFIITAMFLLVLFYAYAGVVLFGMVKFGQAVSKHVNFRTGKDALVVLFRSVTGEDWNDIMHDCMRSPPLCYWAPGLSYWQTDCGNYFGAIIYFCSFYLIITYITLNLLVAIIMENFSLFYSSEEDALLSYADIRNYQQQWNMIDVEQKHYIPVRRVKFILRLLTGRLQVDPWKDRLLFKHMCHEMDRLNNGDDVSFHDILNMLSYRSVDIRKSLQLEELVQREELEYAIEEEVAKQTIRTWLEQCLRRIKQQKQKQQQQSPPPASGLGSISGSKKDGMSSAAPTPIAKIPPSPATPSMIGNSVGSTPQPLSLSPTRQQLLIGNAIPPQGDNAAEGALEEKAAWAARPPKGWRPQTFDYAASATAASSRSGSGLRRSTSKQMRTNRRSSIPDMLVGEAKRFVWGSRLKAVPEPSSMPDRPHFAQSEESLSGDAAAAAAAYVAGGRRRSSILTILRGGTTKSSEKKLRKGGVKLVGASFDTTPTEASQQQQPPCELPDLEEWEEEWSSSPGLRQQPFDRGSGGGVAPDEVEQLPGILKSRRKYGTGGQRDDEFGVAAAAGTLQASVDDVKSWWDGVLSTDAEEGATCEKEWDY